MIQAILKFIQGVLLVMMTLFIPARTWHFVHGWILMGILFIPMFCVELILMFKNPDLLVKRLNVKETENVQKYVIAGTGIMFIIGFVLAGMNAREHWHDLPQWVVIAGIVVFLLSYASYEYGISVFVFKYAIGIE